MYGSNFTDGGGVENTPSAVLITKSPVLLGLIIVLKIFIFGMLGKRHLYIYIGMLTKLTLVFSFLCPVYQTLSQRPNNK